MAYVEQSQETELTPEKMEKIRKAVALLQEAAERHEQTLPDTLSAKEMDDLYEAATLYEECKDDFNCSRENLRFALEDFTSQIRERQKTVGQFLKAKKPSPRDQSRSEQLKGWGASAEFKERYNGDPLKDLADLNRKYAGKPQMIETDEEKIRCYQTAKFFEQQIKNDMIRPRSDNEKKSARFAELAIQELQGEVEALLAGRVAEAA